MIISTINYSQNIGKADEWHLENVNFGRLNLVVSRNGVGKTRTVNILNALARMLSGRIPGLLNGNWDVVFERDSSVLRYVLEIEGAKVLNERLSLNEEVMVERSGEEGEIVFFVNGKRSKKKFYPPGDKLTNQVRRDKRELPYLEELIKWGEDYRSFQFSNIRPNQLAIRTAARGGPTGPEMPSEDLSIAPYLLEEIKDEVSKRQILKDLEHMGYRAKDLSVVAPSIPGLPRDVLVMRVIENGITFPIDQIALSQGMYRAIASVVMVNHLMLRSMEGTLVIDDLGEGLDFERSSKLIEILFKRVENTGIQLIVTSNDRFLMNTVDIKYWNVFERKGGTVQSFNYKNSKKAFDDFALTGLNNFDFFADKLYKGIAHD